MTSGPEELVMPPSAALALVFVGAVLFVNGLGLLGKVSKGAAGTLNVFVGVLFAAVVLSRALPAQDMASAFTGSGFLLFGVFYLYTGVMDLTGHRGEGGGLVLRLGGCGFARHLTGEVLP